jgi:F420-dependent oxidoreductase-like protein
MQIVLMVEGQEGVTWDEWVALAQAAEDAGLHGFFRSDHYTMIQGTPGGALDAWSTISGLAAITKTLRLGTLVSPMTFRHPSNMARVVTSADHISGGRVEMGIDTGWFELEHTQNGFAFPDMKTRFDMLIEQVEVIVKSWTEDNFSHEGAHYQLQNQSALPHPVQNPHPPIVIGGAAGPRSLALGAKYAAEYNSFLFSSVEEVAQRRAALDGACQAIGRDPATLAMSVMGLCAIGENDDDVAARTANALGRMGQMAASEEAQAAFKASPAIGTVDALTERFRAYGEAGVDRIYLQLIDRTDLGAVALMGKLANALR